MNLRSITIVGPECTGKTTLASRLASLHGAPLALEYARIYAEQCFPRPLTADDVEPIVEGEEQLLDAAKREAIQRGSRLVVRDTDLLSSWVWATILYADRDFSWLGARARAKKADLYLLARPDTPYVDDPVRDAHQDRDFVYSAFDHALATLGQPVIVISGDWPERERQATLALAALLR